MAESLEAAVRHHLAAGGLAHGLIRLAFEGGNLLCRQGLQTRRLALDGGKLRRGGPVGLRGGRRHFARDGFGTVFGVGVVAEKLSHGGVAGLVFLFELFEEGGHLMRVVAGVIHQVGSHQVRLRLGPARVLQEI